MRLIIEFTKALSDFAYMLSTNQGKARGRAYKGTADIRHSRHRTVGLTSAELSLAETAVRGRRRRLGGEAVRLIEVPATADDQDHIFDRLPRLEDAEKEAKRVSRLYGKLTQDAEHYHGAAFRKYLKGLIQVRGILRSKVAMLVAAFQTHVQPDSDGPVVRDLAAKFGLLFAGGVIGIELDIVPWKRHQVLSAITTCYRRARALIVDDGLLVTTGLLSLQAGLKMLPQRTALGSHPSQFNRLDGYHAKSVRGGYYLIKNETFNRLLPDIRQRQLVIAHLVRRNCLEVAQGRRVNGRKVSAPKEQHFWPDGVRRRSLKILSPMEDIGI